MKRSLTVLLALLLILLMTTCSTACSGYNGVMYGYLKDRDNYATYTVTVTEICAWDSKYLEKTTDLADERFENGHIVFCCIFDSYEAVSAFLGTAANEEVPLSDYPISLEITPKSHAALTEAGFYEAFTVGDTLEITASSLIYMDGEFFYIAGLTYGDTEYLSVTKGLQNIVDMMKRNRSFF